MSSTTMLIDPLPDGWKNVQLGDLCDRVSDSYRPVSSGDTPYIGLEHLAQGFPAFVGRGIESDIKSQKTAFRANDVLFGKLRPYLRKGAKAGFNGVCSTDILAFRAKGSCDPNFLQYLIHSDPFIAHAIATTTGVQHPRTSWPSLREFKLSAPPLSEQKSIATVLASVQKTIEVQERIIQTATELKQALMQKLFSEGLRGEPQKETEIGLVPESWEVVKLSQIADLKNGYAFKSTDYVAVSNTLNIRMSNIRPGAQFDMEYNQRFLPDHFAETHESFLLEDGDLIIAMTDMANDPKILGVPTLIRNPTKKKLLLNQRVGKLVLAEGSNVNIEFLRYYLSRESVQRYLISCAKKGVQVNIGKKDILSAPIAFPKADEQQIIVDCFNALGDKTTAAEKNMDLLHKLFHTLLHELITAKIRVHELDVPTGAVTT